MADEIRGTISLNVDNGNFAYAKNETFTLDQATVGGANPGTVDVGTSEEAISFGDITNLGWVFMKNLDTTNYVEWGPESGGALVVVGRLEAGESALFRLSPAITLRMQANTATCKVLIEAMWD